MTTEPWPARVKPHFYSKLKTCTDTSDLNPFSVKKTQKATRWNTHLGAITSVTGQNLWVKWQDWVSIGWHFFSIIQEHYQHLQTVMYNISNYEKAICFIDNRIWEKAQSGPGKPVWSICRTCHSPEIHGLNLKLTAKKSGSLLRKSSESLKMPSVMVWYVNQAKGKYRETDKMHEQNNICYSMILAKIQTLLRDI